MFAARDRSFAHSHRSLLSKILPGGTVLLRDAADGLVPSNHPGNENGKYQACAQSPYGSLSEVAPIQPEGKINFEREHAQERNGRGDKSDNGENLGEAASDISPQSAQASPQNAVRHGVAGHLPE